MQLDSKAGRYISGVELDSKAGQYISAVELDSRVRQYISTVEFDSRVRQYILVLSLIVLAFLILYSKGEICEHSFIVLNGLSLHYHAY